MMTQTSAPPFLPDLSLLLLFVSGGEPRRFRRWLWLLSTVLSVLVVLAPVALVVPNMGLSVGFVCVSLLANLMLFKVVGWFAVAVVGFSGGSLLNWFKGLLVCVFLWWWFCCCSVIAFFFVLFTESGK